MVKFQAPNPENGRKILGLGLSRGNLQRLQEGKPIHFNAEQMGLPAIAVSEVLVFFGETEESMRAELEANGYLDGCRIIEDTADRRM